MSNACIYEGTTIDADANITNSIVLEQSRIGARSEVVDSVVARSCTIEEDVRQFVSDLKRLLREAPRDLPPDPLDHRKLP